MTLKYSVDTIEEVPEPLREHYEEKDGKFVLRAEGVAPKEKVDEFRETNIALQKQIQQLQTQFEGVDPQKYRELTTRAQQERDRKLIDAGKVDELVAERTAAMKNEHERAQRATQDQMGKMTSQLERLLIDNAIRDAAAHNGVRGSAVDDVLLRGRATFKLVEGVAVPMNGEKTIYGRNGDVMTIGEWIASLNEKAPHLFESSQGSGARGSVNPNLPPGTIARGDNNAFLANLDKIAGGKVKVV